MKNLYSFLVLAVLFSSCGTKLPTSLGDPKNAQSFGYQPIDPLPTTVGIYHGLNSHGFDSISIMSSLNRLPNKRIMASLPDETMRLAIGQQDGKGNISFASAKLGYAGSSYIVILDYIKFDTKSLSAKVLRDSSNNIVNFKSVNKNGDYSPDQIAIMPVYVGVGLRFTATITVNEGTVDLGNLFALGLAAESKKVTGTLVIQTLGISGKDISALIPMPSQINTTTIQNAILSLASIKSKIYEEEVELNPRVVGFYNNIGGGQSTVHNFITNILSDEMKHLVK